MTTSEKNIEEACQFSAANSRSPKCRSSGILKSWSNRTKHL